MSGAVSEEDVLALLVIRACRPVVTNCYNTAQTTEATAYRQCELFDTGPAGAAEVMEARLWRMGTFGCIEAAIADSERRWEVEQAEREVLQAAERWYDAEFSTAYEAGCRLVRSVRLLREAAP